MTSRTKSDKKSQEPLARLCEILLEFAEEQRDIQFPWEPLSLHNTVDTLPGYNLTCKVHDDQS